MGCDIWMPVSNNMAVTWQSTRTNSQNVTIGGSKAGISRSMAGRLFLAGVLLSL